VTAATIWRWLIGADRDEYVSRKWLKDRKRLAGYVRWTRRENKSAIVVASHTDILRREAWDRATGKLPPVEKHAPADVSPFRKRA
jgi:hypothetical protein